MEKLITKPQEFDASVCPFTPMKIPTKILMVNPSYFDIEYSINPHMKDIHGNLNRINKTVAREQWLKLKQVYENLGFEVSVLNGVPGLPDMVFCANQTFPFVDTFGYNHVILSNMYSDARQHEVEPIANFFKDKNYKAHSIAQRNTNHFFESTGDAFWVPGFRLILGGYGFRTNLEIYPLLAEKTQSKVAILKLINPRFYHLDTCLSVINQTTALYCPSAFDADGINLLNKIFPNLLEVPLNEADSPGFACNAHSPDQKHVILQKGSFKTNEILVQNGFIPIEVETNEFIKAGGSVFCMKLMFF